MSARPIVVLGGGPAGMSAAWHLAKAGRRVVVLEKAEQVGGLGATVAMNGFRLDYGPHVLSVRETPESDAMIQELLPFFGERPLAFERTDRLLLHGKYYHYPVRILELLGGVSFSLMARILWDYVRANATLRFYPPTQGASFEEWGVKNLGRTLYELCFGVYSRRVWGLPTSQISSRQAQRVAKLNLTEIILRTLGLKVDTVTHYRRFLYPRRGIGIIYERMAEEIRALGGEIRTGAAVTRLLRRDHRVEGVVYQSASGGEQRLDCEGVVSTLPLPLVGRCFEPALAPAVCDHAARLRYRSLQFCYFIVRRPRVTDFHWCYLLDERFRCNRVSEQKNVSEEMVPGPRTVLLFELSCDKGDAVWNATEEGLRAIVEPDLRRARFLDDLSVIEGFFARRVEYAYPVYELNFEERLFPVLEALHAHDNFLSVGRHGLFLNNSMDDNILLGKRLSQFMREQPDGRWNPHRWFREMTEFMRLRYEGK